jgi:hypothetical protein
MNRALRTGRVLKWVGAVLCAVVALAWAFCRLGGSVAIGNVPTVNEPQLKLAHGDLSLNLGWAEVATRPPQPKYLGFIDIPLLGVLILLAIPTVLLWWADRRRIAPGHCRNCGYDMTGNVSGRCPECGTAVPPIAGPHNRRPGVGAP